MRMSWTLPQRLKADCNGWGYGGTEVPLFQSGAD